MLWNCGEYGHKASECRSSPKGAKGAKGGKRGGKGAKGGKGGKGRVVIPGCCKVIETESYSYLELTVVFLSLLSLMLVVLLKGTDSTAVKLAVKFAKFLRFEGEGGTTRQVLALVAPIITYGSMKVKNQMNEAKNKERFTVKVSSVLPESFVSKHKAIFDPGAAKHILNSTSHMMGLTADNSNTVIGVTGADTCNYTGYINMAFHATRWDDGSECIVEMKGDDVPPLWRGGRKKRNALLVEASPLSLVSWHEIKKAGSGSAI